MSQWAEIRNLHLVEGVAKKQIAQRLQLDIKTVRRAALEAPRRAHPGQVPHEQPQVDAADLHEPPFQDVGMPAQMHAAHPAGLGATRGFTTGC